MNPRQTREVDDPAWRPAVMAAANLLELLAQAPDRIRRCQNPGCVLWFFALLAGSDPARHTCQAHGIFNGMRSTIDKAGRLVIPKTLRDSVGLVPGEVEITPDGTGLHIEPLADDCLEDEDGLLVMLVDDVPSATTSSNAADGNQP